MMKFYNSHILRYLSVILVFILSITVGGRVFAQCGGGYGAPLFLETFGSGTNYGPALTQDLGAGTDYSAGATAYIFDAVGGNVQDNHYTITTSPQKAKSDWVNVPDHTGNTNGKMLVVNASYAPGVFYKRKVTGICKNTNFLFSAWLIEINSSRILPANVDFEVQDSLGNIIASSPSGDIYGSTSTTRPWMPFSFPFNTANYSTVYVVLRNNAPGGGGNDLAIDDISFQACGPKISFTGPTGPVCLGNTVTFTANASSGYVIPYYQWQISTDGGTTWGNISGANASTYTINKVALTDNSHQFRAQVAGSLDNLLNGNCSVSSGVATLTVQTQPVKFTQPPSPCINGGIVNLVPYGSPAGGIFSGPGITGNNFDPSTLVAGTTYKVYYTYQNPTTSCSSTDSTTITVLSKPVTQITKASATACPGQTIQLSIVGSGTIQWYFNGTAITGATGTTYFAPTTGLYKVVQTNASGCFSFDTTSIRIFTAPVLFPSGSSVSICQGQNATLTTSVAALNYKWTLGSSTTTLSSTNTLVTGKAGTYTLKIVDNNGCITSANYVVNVINPPIVDLQIVGDTTFCKGDSVAFGVFNKFTTYQWYKSTTGAVGSYVAIPGATSNSYFAKTAGYYYITVTNGSGCPASTPPHQVTVIPPPAVPHVTASSTLPVCYPGNVTVSTPPVAGLSYQWRWNGKAQPNSNFASYVAQNTGYYSVMAINASGCQTLSDSVLVTINPKPVASISYTTLTNCGGVPVILSANKQTGYTYQWLLNNAPFTVNGTHTNDTLKTVTTGLYSYIVTNATGCKDTSTQVKVNVYPKITPTVIIDGASTLCAPDSVTLEVTGTFASYQWYENGNPIASTNQRTIRVGFLGTNTYSVSVVDVNGCTAVSNTVSATINPQPVPFITGSNTTFCFGNGPAVLSATTGFSNYVWKLDGNIIQGATTNIYVANVGGNYTVTVTNGSGCVGTSLPIVVTVNPLPNPHVQVTGAEHFCAPPNPPSNDVLHTVNPIPGSTYEWHQINISNIDNIVQSSTDSTYAVPSVIASEGQYYEVMTTPSGCSAYSDTVTISLYTPPVSNLGSPSICSGGSDATTLYSPPGMNFQWFYSATGIAGSFTNAPGASTGISYIATQVGYYYVQLQDGSGCTGTSSTVFVKQKPTLQVTVPPAPAACQGNSAILSATVTLSPVGTLPANIAYQWSFQPNSTGAYHKINGAVFSQQGVDSTGTYKVVVSRSGYCSDSTTVVYTETIPAKPVIEKNDSLCVGSSIILANNQPASPVLPPGVTYQWFRNYIAIPGPAGTAPTYTVTDDGYYYMRVANPATTCVSYSDTAYIKTNPLPKPSIQITGPTVVCSGTAVNLYVSKVQDFKYQWSYSATGTAGSFNPITIPVPATDTMLSVTANTGYYQITETTGSGCSGTDQIFVEVDSIPVLHLPATASVCQGGFVTLQTGSHANLTWSYKTQTNIISTAMSIQANLPGTYYLMARNAGNNRCYSIDSTILTVNPLPVAAFSALDSCRQSDTTTFKNTSTIADNTTLTYLWNYGDPASGAKNTSTAADGGHQYLAIGNYTVTLTATSVNGCINTVTNNYYFKGTKPVANFKIVGYPGKLCGGTPVQLRDTSTNQFGAITGYSWAFFTAAGKPVAISVDAVKDVFVDFPDTNISMTYRIKLTVTAQSGCIDTTSQLVTIGSSPVVTFTLPQRNVCITQSVPDTLRGGSPVNGTNGGVGTYVGVGVTNGVFNPKVAGLGKHPIQYNFTDPVSGCTSSAIDTVNVIAGPAPVIIFVPSGTGACSKSAKLTAFSSTAASYIWLLNDTVINNADTSFYVATKAGKYTVRAFTAAGCSRDTSVNLTIGQGPIAAFVVGSTCQNLIVNFLNQSVSQDKSALTYKWDFGDPSSGANVNTGANPQHQYSGVGNWLVTLIATNAGGCPDTLKKMINVSAVDSNANFIIRSNMPYCVNEPLIFEDSSYLPGQIITGYTWKFYDNAGNVIKTDSGAVVSESFPVGNTPTTFSAQEILTTSANCPVVTPIKKFTINPITPVTYVREGPRDMCDYASSFALTGGSTVPPGQPGTGYYSGAGVVDSNTFVPSKAPIGEDPVSYIFTNQYGCMSSATTQYVVHDTIPLTGQNYDTNQGTLINLNGIAALPFVFGPDSGITQINADSLKWNWSPSTGLSSATVPNPSLIASDDITYQLTVTSPFGCISRAAFVVKVHQLLHVPNAFTPNGDGINDTWIIKGLEDYPDVDVFVFNRWGQQLFHSKGYGQPWNGYFNGKPLPMGTYYYLIKLNGKGQKPLTGPLTLLY